MKTIKTRKVLIAIIIILLFIDAVVLGFFIVKNNPAETARSHNHSSALHEVLKEKVHFDTTQLQQFDEIRDNHFKIIKPLFANMRKAKETFYTLVYKPTATDSVKNALADSIGLKQKQIDLQMLTYFKDVRALCTEEQLPAFDSSIQKVMIKMTGRRGKHTETKAK